ncbi:MAG TPA: MFS transporter [Verrucomicrobiae bacterium]|jgi:FHS family glucose/mannose:H+ symporter-like MFS transporter|nr:MFS transporter [Verrucomicrobiae bacterium]
MDRVISPRLAGSSTDGSRLFTQVASAGFVLTGVVNTFLGPILPVLAARWQLSDSRSGYFFAMQFVGSMLGVSISSFLLPRRGFRFTIGLSYLLMAAGVGCLALAQWRYGLLGTFALGLGFGVAIPATNLLISGANQHRRASALSILNFCWGLGAVSAPLALYIAARQNQVQTFVVLLSGLLLLAALGTAIIGRIELKSDEKESPDPQRTAPQWRFVAMIGGMFFLYVAIEASVGGWIATLAKRAPSGMAGSWVMAPSLFWGGLLAGRGIAPLVLSRMRERRMALASLTVAGMGMCILLVSSQWQWISAAGLVVGFGLAAIFPITVALLSHFQGMEKRRAGPMFAMAGLGGALMPWLVGAVSSWSGSLRAGLMVPLLAIGLLLWLHAVGNHGSEPVADQILKESRSLAHQ